MANSYTRHGQPAARISLLALCRSPPERRTRLPTHDTVSRRWPEHPQLPRLRTPAVMVRGGQRHLTCMCLSSAARRIAWRSTGVLPTAAAHRRSARETWTPRCGAYAGSDHAGRTPIAASRSLEATARANRGRSLRHTATSGPQGNMCSCRAGRHSRAEAYLLAASNKRCGILDP
jgi:hypothetical protein